MIRISSTYATAWTLRVLAWATVAWFLGSAAVGLLVVLALMTLGSALALHACRGRPLLARRVLVGAVGALLLILLSTLRSSIWPVAVPAGIGVFVCLAVSFLVDVQRGEADARRPFAALLYLVQFPVFPGGPLSRFQEFSQQLARTDVSMGAFSYAVRRIVTGLIKIGWIAGPLGSTADAIFALRVTRLSTDAAWLGAVCGALEFYFHLSGFADVGIGIGRMLGFRYQENFRRPYTAESMREFWRRWNVTLVTWLRDYLSLPIAGHDRPTFRLYLLTVAGFLVIGAWHRSDVRVVPWAVYFASWLALEAIGLGLYLQRMPRALRHLYVALVAIFGWMLLRAAGPGPLLGYLEAMFGFSVVPFGGSAVYLTPGFVTAFISAIVFAGPLVGWISRWRVSVDAATASLIMMFAATGILLWHLVMGLRRIVLWEGPPKRSR